MDGLDGSRGVNVYIYIIYIYIKAHPQHNTTRPGWKARQSKGKCGTCGPAAESHTCQSNQRENDLLVNPLQRSFRDQHPLERGQGVVLPVVAAAGAHAYGCIYGDMI